uniref:Uncharacterized protein n=1 Tax=Alexandrium monilatum TaxID=311494 RepID=A0A7S4SEM8_9DINO
MMSSDPAMVFGTFLDRQQRFEQFSEDMKKVVHTGAGTGSSSCGPRVASVGRRSSSSPSYGRAAHCTLRPVTLQGATGRTRSPGLAAGAALALGGGSTAAEVHAEAHTQRRHATEYARRRECPFDNHTAFGARAGELGPRPPQLPRHAEREARMVTEASQALGRQNRQLQQRVGATPFDAPEHERASSSSIAASGAALQPQALADAHAEMVRNKQRMQGSRDLIAGDYLQGSGTASRRNGSLPPRPNAELLPEAQMRFQLKGGSVASLTHGKAAYLNSAVMADNVRLRNESVAFQLS